MPAITIIGKNMAHNQNTSQNPTASANKVVSDADIWSENLRKNEEQRRKDSKWFNMQPGDKAVLEFLPEFGPVMKDFDGDEVAETLRYEYKVIDINHREDGAKPWDVSKTWSEDIDYHLKQGNNVLKVERVGSGKKTKYHFTPAPVTASANSAATC